MRRGPRTRSRARESIQLREHTECFVEGQEHVGSLSDESAWSDIEETTHSSRPTHRSTPSPAGSLRSATPRKRSTLQRTASKAISPRKQATILSSPKPVKLGSSTTTEPAEKAIPAVISSDDMVNNALKGAMFTSRYALDVFSTAIHLLRKPLSVLLFFYLLALIMSRISHTLRGAFAPLCILPGFSSSSLCRTDTSLTIGKQVPRWADYPRLIDVQSKTFGQLLDESVGGSGLALEIKKAEIATSDLVTLVRVSKLKSRDMLAESLADFVDDAKKTGRGLQKLNSKVGGAVDNIMAVNDWALHAIEAAHSNVPSRFSLSALVPWTSARPAEDVVTETFSEAMSTLSANMQRLILEAEVNLANLEALEERLGTLHEMVAREDSSLSSAKSELLAELWTKLGGNKRTLRGFDSHLALLKELSEYRKQALVHVVAALQALQSMSEDMEDIRERVAAPELVGSRIPVEVHIKSIKNGLERLKEGRIKAKNLEGDAMRRILGITSGEEADNVSERHISS